VDPCLFTKGSVVLVLYVEDACLLLPSKKVIDDVIKSLAKTFMLTDEGDLRDYLGVHIERKGNKTTLTQPRIINQCLELIGLKFDKEMKVKTFNTPADPSQILQQDSNGKQRGSMIGNIMPLLVA
jgi:hypothetical protein